MNKFFESLTRFILLLTAAAAVFYIWARLIEPSVIRVRRVSVETQSLPASARGLKIALFSDTHIGFGFDVSDLKKAVEKINALQPDIIAFTGDLFDDYGKWKGKDDAVIDALLALDAKIGKYAVLGNHDYVPGAKKPTQNILMAAGFEVLYNDTLYLPKYGISLFGMDDCIYGQGSAGAFMHQPGLYNIVLCHEPDVFAELSGADFMLSGHTHGGQVCPPLVKPLVLPRMGKKYAAGLYEERGGQLFVSRGLGTTIMKLRFLCPPEIDLLTLS